MDTTTQSQPGNADAAGSASPTRPDIFAKFRPLQERHAMIRELTGADPLGMRIERMESPTRAWIAGKPVILMGSNNYLGLTFNPDSQAAAVQALSASGTGTTGSRAANGSYACHQGIEQQLAEFFGLRKAVLFTTGYQANVGFISAIVGKDDILLIDSDSHASIYDGCKLSDATIYRFRHNDPEDLARRIERLPPQANKLIVVEGIYSMLGDYAPLKELVAVAKRYGAYLMVDEAHSLGVLGPTGGGLAQHLGLVQDIDFIVGTFSKSVGTIGGFCVSNHEALDTVRFAARAYLFTASLPPSVVASASASLERIRTDPSLREKLWANTDYIYDGLRALGLQIGPNKTPVIGIAMPDAAACLRGWRTLLESGVYVNLALPPATPGNMALLRCSICAAHTREQLDTVLAAFKRVKAQLG